MEYSISLFFAWVEQMGNIYNGQFTLRSFTRS